MNNLIVQIEDLKKQMSQLERDIEDKQGEICSVQSSIETFEYECTNDEFDDFLDDVQPEVNIYGMTFYPSDILKSCDPIAYRCAKSDYESDYDLDNCEEYKDLKDQLESLENELESLESDLEYLQNELESLESEDE